MPELKKEEGERGSPIHREFHVRGSGRPDLIDRREVLHEARVLYPPALVPFRLGSEDSGVRET